MVKRSITEISFNVEWKVVSTAEKGVFLDSGGNLIICEAPVVFQGIRDTDLRHIAMRCCSDVNVIVHIYPTDESSGYSYVMFIDGHVGTLSDKSLEEIKEYIYGKER